MDVLHYSENNTYQGQGRQTASDLGLSVEDLAYSMRQDLLFQQQQQQSNSDFDQVSQHLSVKDNLYPYAPQDCTGNSSSSRPNSSLSSRSSSAAVHTESYGLSPSTQISKERQHMESYQQSSQPSEGSPNGYPSTMDYNTVQHSPARHPAIQNHHVIEQVTFKKSAKSFYQELYGQSENNNSIASTDSSGQRSNYDTSQDGSFDSPRMLPKPPLEPRQSKTRSSLRRAAKALLNRSRQNLSDTERRTRKPEKPQKPPPAEGKFKRSGSIREKLQKNRDRMAEVLKKPAFMRRGSQGNESTTDTRSVSSEYNSYDNGRRRYGSTGNLNPNMDDVDDTAPIHTLQQHADPPSHRQRYSSLDNIRPSYPSNDSLHLNGQSYGHPRLSHSSTSDLESQTSGSDCRSYGSREVLHVPRSASPGYQLRRHSSGPVYNGTSPRERDTVQRGYHTADSDTDSSLGRLDGYWPHGSNRHETRRPLPSTRDTLRMLQKKREGASSGQQRGMSKVQSGPLRADHNIQTVRKEESSPMESSKDLWLEQGARPKRTQSTESLETEEVKHELLPDSIIRVDREPEHSSGRQSRNSNNTDQRSGRDSAMSNRSRQRAPSPSRSVHFEDSNSPQHYRNSNSRPPSRSAMRPPADHKQRSRVSSDSSPYESEYSSCDLVEPPYPYSDGAQEQNRNNSGYANPVTDIELHHGNSYYGQNGNMSGDSTDSSSPRGRRRKQTGNHGNQQQYENGVMHSGYEHPSAFHPASRGRTPTSQSPNYNQYGGIEDAGDRSRPSSRASQRTSKEPPNAKLDKSHRKRASSQPPPSNHKTSSMRPAGSRESVASSGSNPCVVSDADDSIMQIGTEFEDRQKHPFTSDLDNYSDISGSRLSIASRASISEKVQNVGRATKKKFHSMRRALSLDRMDKVGQSSEQGPKLKKSPSLRSLTSILGKKKSKKDDSDHEYPSHLDKKHRSASVIGLYNRPQRSTPDTDVTLPSHGRKVGRLISRDPDGSQTIELVKPPAGPFGFYIARGTYDFGSGIFVTRLGDGHPAKILAGLLGVGDEILEINGEGVGSKPIDDVYDIMMDNNMLVLRVVPLMARNQTK